MPYTYKLAQAEDFEGFYKIKCDSQNVIWSGFSTPPNHESLQDWFLSNLINPNRQIFLVWKDDVEIIGFFYLDKISDTIFEAASSGVLSMYTKQGIGTKTIQWREELARENGAEIIQTWVSENNLASFHRLEKLNWVRTELFEYKDIPLAGGKHRFYKWQKSLK